MNTLPSTTLDSTSSLPDTQAPASLEHTQRQKQDAARQARLESLSSMYIYDREDTDRSKIDADPIFRNYINARHDPDDFHMLMGDEVSHIIGNGNVYDTAEYLIASLPQDEQSQYRRDLDHSITSDDGRRVVSRIMERHALKGYQRRKQEQADYEAFEAKNADTLSKLLAGHSYDEFYGEGNSINRIDMQQLGEQMDISVFDLGNGLPWKKKAPSSRNPLLDMTAEAAGVNMQKVLRINAVMQQVRKAAEPTEEGDFEAHDAIRRVGDKIGSLVANLSEIDEEGNYRIPEEDLAYIHRGLMTIGEEIKERGDVDALDNFNLAFMSKFDDMAAFFVNLEASSGNERISQESLDAQKERHYKSWQVLEYGENNPAFYNGRVIRTPEEYAQVHMQRMYDQNARVSARELARKQHTAIRQLKGAFQAYAQEASSSSDKLAWYKKVAKGAASMAGDSSLYLLPVAGQAIGTAATLTTGYERGMNNAYFSGLRGGEAQTRAWQDAGIQAAVEIMPWSRVGGSGLNKWAGRMLQRGVAGHLSRGIAKISSRGGAAAYGLEVGGMVISEGIIEPLAGGVLTWTSDRAMDALGIPHGQTRTAKEAFGELSALYEDSAHAGALTLFSAVLNGSRVPVLLSQSRHFAKQRETWERMGLSKRQAQRVIESESPLDAGRKLWHEEMAKDPSAVRERMRKKSKEQPEEGSILLATGQMQGAEGATNRIRQETWREMQQRGYLPQVESLGERDGEEHFRITELTPNGEQVLASHEFSAKKADDYLAARITMMEERHFKGQQNVIYGAMADHASQIVGESMAQAAEETKGGKGITIENLNELPEGVGEQVQRDGMLTIKTIKLAAEKLGDVWKSIFSSFAERQAIAEQQGETAAGSAVLRIRETSPYNSRGIHGSTIHVARGNARAHEVLEDTIESFADMDLQERALRLAQEQNLTPEQARKAAFSELLHMVRSTQDSLLRIDSSLKLPELKEDASYMELIETLSQMGISQMLTTGLLPKELDPITDMIKGAVDLSAQAVKLARAWKKAKDQGLEGLPEISDYFEHIGMDVRDTFSRARIDERVLEAVRKARPIIQGQQQLMGVEVPTAEQIQEDQATAQAQDEAQEAFEDKHRIEPTPEQVQASHASDVEQQLAHISTRASSTQLGIFVDDAAVYNKAGGYWMGCIPVKHLSDSKDVEQVKAGAKGKHGVINPITGDYQQDTEAIYVWKRKDGRLEVISGRHKYDLALRTNTEAVTCYLYTEDAKHDAKWARLLDFENNMRGDQADELTAAIYTRETGYSDQQLQRKGLMRNKSKSKRGILIGREAREELWTRFKNGAVSPMDAEIIVQMTKNLRKPERIEDIQTKCVNLLDQKKSWDYISAMVQLMASKESIFMKQGLLDLGADFEADMEKAAAFIEKSVQGLNEAITIIKQGKKLSGKKKQLAQRLGLSTTSQSETEQKLDDLTLMKEMFASVGAYPELIAAAQMWDGKTELDPVGYALTYATKTRERANEEKEMSREDWEQSQVDYSGMGELSFSVRRTIDELGLSPRDVVRPQRHARTREEAKKTLLRVRDTMFQRREGSKKDSDLVPILGSGVTAKDTDFEAFVTSKTIKKATSAEALKKTLLSASADYHFIAAANIDHLWKQSFAFTIKPDKKGKGNIKGVHQRIAYILINQDLCQVKLTAKEFHNEKDINHLYSVEIESVEKINELDVKAKRADSQENNPRTHNQAQDNNTTSSPDVKPTFSIAGRRAQGFEKAKAEGLTYIDQKDGKEKFFLDVSSAKIRDDLDLHTIQKKGQTDKYTELADVLDFPDLYEAYPHFKNFKVSIYGFRDLIGGEFVENTKVFGRFSSNQWGHHSIAINTNIESFSNREALLSIVIHEVQHAIQAYEGFSTGFSSSPSHSEALAYLREAIRQRRHLSRLNEKNKANYEALVELEKELRENPNSLHQRSSHRGGIADLLYSMSAGEMEAKFAEERLPHNGYLWSTLDSYALFPNSVSVKRPSFEGRKPDISFSVRNLVSAHTLDVSRLKESAKLGGMPLPSIAVTRIDKPYAWGSPSSSLTLIAGSELADPEQGNDVYTADAYTGVFPATVNKKSDKAQDVLDKIQKFAKQAEKYNLESASSIYDSIVRRLESSQSKSEQINNLLHHSNDMYLLFAAKSKYKPQLGEVERKALRWADAALRADSERFADILNSSSSSSEEKSSAIDKFALQIESAVERIPSDIEFKGSKILALKRTAKSISNKAFDFESAITLATEISEARKAGYKKPEVLSLTHMKEHADANPKKFDKFKQEIAEYYSDELILEESGETVTLDNVTRHMKYNKSRGNEQGALGMNNGQVFAARAQKIHSLTELKSQRDTLVSTVEHSELKSSAVAKMEAFGEALAASIHEDYFTARDTANKILADAPDAHRSSIANTMRSAHLSWKRGAKKAQLEILGAEAIEAIDALPMDYFESVPQRAVALNEWKFALASEELKKDKELTKILRENKIKPIWHDGTQEGRAEAMASLQKTRVTFSMRSFTESAMSARAVFAERADEKESIELLKRYDFLIDTLQESLTASSKDETLGTGAQRYAAILSLLEATKGVLPEKYARMGNLNGLLKWAAVYAQMIETGEIPRTGSGVLKGYYAEKFVRNMKRKKDRMLLQGLSEEEVHEAMATLAAERIETSLLKVANAARAKVDMFIKDRAWERIELTAERAYPKKEKGRKSPRGKLDSEGYRQMEYVLSVMRMNSDEIAEEMAGLRGRIAELIPNSEHYTARKDALEEQLNQATIFGNWAGKSAPQAQSAAEAFVALVMQRKTLWEQQLEKRVLHRHFVMNQLKARFKVDNNANNRSAGKRSYNPLKMIKRVGKETAYGLMSYNQLMLSAKKVFGEHFVRERIQEMTDANQALGIADSEADTFFATAVAEAIGIDISKDNALIDWLNDFGKVRNTGIKKHEFVTYTIKLAIDEARAWVMMSKEEREAKREKLIKDATDEELAVRNIPNERDIWMMEQELNKYDGKLEEMRNFITLRKRNEDGETTIALKLTIDEARAWVALNWKERAAKRKELIKKNNANNIPTDEQIWSIKKKLQSYDEKSATESFTVKQKWIEVRGRHKSGNTVELVASKDAVANAILLFEQEDYEHLIEYEGFIPIDAQGNVIDRNNDRETPIDAQLTLKPLYDFIGADALRLAHMLRRRVSENFEGVAKKYAQERGINIAQKPKYWRGNFNLNIMLEKDTLTQLNASAGAGYGFLIDRVKHYSAIEWTNTMSEVFLRSIKDQNNYLYTSHITNDWRAMLMDTSFSRGIELELGKEYLDTLKSWINIIDGASMADEIGMNQLKRILNGMMRGVANAALSGNGWVLAKQSSAILHGMLGGEVPREVIEGREGIKELEYRHIGMGEFTAAMARSKTGQAKISLDELATSKAFMARMDSPYKRIAQRMRLKDGQRQHRYLMRFTEKSMDAIDWTDRKLNLLSMHALADAIYHNLETEKKEKNLNWTHEEMVKVALDGVGRALSLSAQPKRITDKSLIGARGGALINIMMMFRSEVINKLGLLIARIMNGEYISATSLHLLYGSSAALVATGIGWIRYGSSDDEEDIAIWKEALAFGVKVASSDLSATPIVGELVTGITSKITGEWNNSRPLYEMFFDPDGIYNNAARLITGEKRKRDMTAHDYVNTSQGFIRAFGAFSGIFLNNKGGSAGAAILDLATAANQTRTVSDMIKKLRELAE